MLYCPFWNFWRCGKNKQFVISGLPTLLFSSDGHLDKINRPNNSQLVSKGRIWMPVNELNVMFCCQKNHQWWHLGCRDAKSYLNRCMQELYLKKSPLTNRPGKPHHCRDQPELLAEQVFDAKLSHLLGLRLPLLPPRFTVSTLQCASENGH